MATDRKNGMRPVAMECCRELDSAEDYEREVRLEAWCMDGPWKYLWAKFRWDLWRDVGRHKCNQRPMITLGKTFTNNCRSKRILTFPGWYWKIGPPLINLLGRTDFESCVLVG